MSYTASGAIVSDTPAKVSLTKGPFANHKHSRKENQTELRHDMHGRTTILDADKFLEHFVPEPAISPGVAPRKKPASLFSRMKKRKNEAVLYTELVRLH